MPSNPSAELSDLGAPGGRLRFLRGDGQWAAPVDTLTADRNYYVRKDGSDANDGFADTAAGAFLTIQKAMQTLREGVNINAHVVTVLVGPGTYAEQAVPPSAQGGTIRLLGNGAVPGDVVLTHASKCIANTECGDFRYGKLRLKATGVFGYCVWARGASSINRICDDIELESTAANVFGIYTSFGAVNWMQDFDENVKAIGTFRNLVASGDFGEIDFEPVILDVTGCSWGAACAESFAGRVYFYYTTLVGAATGKRYNVGPQSAIDTFGGGANYIPGDVAGTVNAAQFGYYA